MSPVGGWPGSVRVKLRVWRVDTIDFQGGYFCANFRISLFWTPKNEEGILLAHNSARKNQLDWEVTNGYKAHHGSSRNRVDEDCPFWRFVNTHEEFNPDHNEKIEVTSHRIIHDERGRRCREEEAKCDEAYSASGGGGGSDDGARTSSVKMRWTRRLTGKFKLDLQTRGIVSRYPFDSHWLGIKLEVRAPPFMKSRLERATQEDNFNNANDQFPYGCMMKPLESTEFRFKEELKVEDDQTSGSENPQIFFEIFAWRKHQYYVDNIIKPNMVILGIAWFYEFLYVYRFFFSEEDRSTAAQGDSEKYLTLLGLTVTFRLAVDGALPKLEQNTDLQQFLNHSIYLLAFYQVQAVAEVLLGTIGALLVVGATFVFLYYYLYRFCTTKRRKHESKRPEDSESDEMKGRTLQMNFFSQRLSSSFTGLAISPRGGSASR